MISLIPYDDAALIPAYEVEVVGVYQNAGYQVNFVQSDDLMAMGGAIHCVTMQMTKHPF
ncbi:MAG: hypothetical protein ACOH5I_01465 [Oligoflexus sp.]